MMYEPPPLGLEMARLSVLRSSSHTRGSIRGGAAVDKMLKGVTEKICCLRRDRTTIKVIRRARSVTPAAEPPTTAAMVGGDVWFGSMLTTDNG